MKLAAEPSNLAWALPLLDLEDLAHRFELAAKGKGWKSLNLLLNSKKPDVPSRSASFVLLSS